ncbi:MAG TPA: methyltransferase [Methanotrichaceae archaeon]|nr:methyltransferase [Methanotrichaceae archaeon]
MECTCCKKGCVQPAKDILAGVDRMYMACPDCAPEPGLDKSRPLKSMPCEIERCRSCKRAPLDAVMLDALRVLAKSGLRDEEDNLRSVGSPLIAVGYPLAYPPRLGSGSLVIVGERLSKPAAEEILRQVPEVKGVILSKGVPGVVNSREGPRENILLAGCDLRADVVQSLFGELVIYKSQSKIHIEFPRQSHPKMKILENLYFQGKIRDVVDGLCGPGTLGLMCVLAGAKRVVLNDIWLPAVENAMLNLEVNKDLLGIEEIERLETPSAAIGKEPVLVGRASGACEIEVYHGDLARLFHRVRPAGLCLIDHFPGVNTRKLEEACRGCGEVVIV